MAEKVSAEKDTTADEVYPSLVGIRTDNVERKFISLRWMIFSNILLNIVVIDIGQ